jgi:hypothetical protein
LGLVASLVEAYVWRASKVTGEVLHILSSLLAFALDGAREKPEKRPSRTNEPPRAD